MIVYNKLVRDKIPEVIESSGKKANIKVLNNKEFLMELGLKLQEELNEYTSSNENEKIEELADMIEVIYAILDAKNVSIEKFESIRNAKKEKRGGFEKQLFLENVEE